VVLDFVPKSRFLRPDRALLLRRRAQTPSRSAVAQTTPQCPTSRGLAFVDSQHGRLRLFFLPPIVGFSNPELFVNTTGQLVKAGQPLFRMYSKEIQLAQIDLSIATGAQGRVGGGLGAQTVEGAVQRLRNLAVPESRIEEVRTKRVNPRTIDWMAPANGMVIEKRIINGQRVMPGEELYHIADLSHMWVIAEVSELDLAAIRVGMNAEVTLRAYASQPISGVVAFIYPDLRPETRAARVRIELPNPDGRLKVDMYAGVAFRTGADRGPVVAVPLSAVIDSGTQQIVLVDKGEGRFEPRGQARRAWQGRYGSAARRQGRRVGADDRDLPDRFGEQLARRVKKLHPIWAHAEMIAAIIRWSARNMFLVGLATVFVTAAGIYAVYRVLQPSRHWRKRTR
jgi:multidrug efflux pump subunit AcrA (membrane-fusion protein)